MFEKEMLQMLKYGVVEPGVVVERLDLEETELGSLALSEEHLCSTELETLVSIEDELARLNAGVGAGSDSLVAHEVTVIAEDCCEDESMAVVEEDSCRNVSSLPDIQVQYVRLLDSSSAAAVATGAPNTVSGAATGAVPGGDTTEHAPVALTTIGQEAFTMAGENDDVVLSEDVLTSLPEEHFSITDEEMIIESELATTVVAEEAEESAKPLALAPLPSPPPPPPAPRPPPVVSSTLVPVLTGTPLTSTGNIRLKSYSGPASGGRAVPATVTGLRQIKPSNSVPKGAVAGNKMILSKVMLGTAQGGMIQVSAGETIAAPQTIRVINTGNKKLISSPTKTITLAQARQMGLLTPSKLHQILPNPANKKIVVSPKNTLTVMKQPARILPAPPPGSAAGQLQSIAPPSTANAAQKVLIRQVGGAIKSGTIVSGGAQGQVIRIPAPQGIAAGNLHQIQLPGKQVQYVRLVNSSSAAVVAASSTPTTVSGAATGKTLLPVSSVTKPIPVALTAVSQQAFKMNTQRVLIPAPSGMTQLKSDSAASAVVTTPLNNFVMVPAQYLQQSAAATAAATAHVPRAQSPAVSAATAANVKLERPPPEPAAPATTGGGHKRGGGTAGGGGGGAPVQTLGPNGIRPRKPCNCTKSQCLKLYCDCFANGEFCHQCNCNSCYNNLEHEEDRQRAIKSCLERNPNAFRPKIGKSYVGDGERRHNKGCNCKRSGCLKNYCECYEAKIPCSNNCKCIGCQNVEDAKALRELALVANMEERSYQQSVVKNKLSAEIQGIALSKPEQSQGPRQPFTLMTQEVVEATCQCLLAQAEDSVPVDEAERLILEEFGRCLVQIIDCANRTAQGQPAAAAANAATT